MTHGKEQSDPLDGFSNLTQAIQDGVRIDYSRLDSKLAKIFHGEHGVLLTQLELQEDSSGLLIHPNLEEPDAWREEGGPLTDLLDESWLGNFGWSLWVEGDIPLNPPTVDELEPGTGFRGEYLNGVCYDYVIYNDRGGKKRAICLSTGVREDPTDIDVIEVYGVGTFEAPNEEA